MRKKNRSFLLMSLVSASLLVSAFTTVQAQSPAAPAAKATKWSDPATWPNRKVPVAGDKVTIDAGKEVVLDVNTPPLNGLTINGKLSFANNKDVELTTEWIMLHGELEIGTEKAPHTRKATITLTDNVKGEDISGVGGTTDRVDRGLEGRRRDCPRLHGLRSPAGRAAQHCGHPCQRERGKHDHARQEARLHALRQDHLRRG